MRRRSFLAHCLSSILALDALAAANKKFVFNSWNGPKATRLSSRSQERQRENDRS